MRQPASTRVGDGANVARRVVHGLGHHGAMPHAALCENRWSWLLCDDDDDDDDKYGWFGGITTSVLKVHPRWRALAPSERTARAERVHQLLTPAGLRSLKDRAHQLAAAANDDDALLTKV